MDSTVIIKPFFKEVFNVSRLHYHQQIYSFQHEAVNREILITDMFISRSFNVYQQILAIFKWAFI